MKPKPKKLLMVLEVTIPGQNDLRVTHSMVMREGMTPVLVAQEAVEMVARQVGDHPGQKLTKLTVTVE